MKRIRLSSAVHPLSEYVTQLRETVLVTDHNRAIAAIIPLRGVDRESIALSQHPGFLEIIATSRADFAAGRTVTLAEMKRRVLGGPRRRRSSPAGHRSRKRRQS